MNAYQELGVAENAGDAEIKSAYRKLAVKYHPDKNPGDKSAEEKFKVVAAAYEMISTADKRRKYSGRGYSAPGGKPHIHVNVDDLFGEMGGFNKDIFEGAASFYETWFGRTRNTKTKGEDINAKIEVSLEDLFQQTKLYFKYTKTECCEFCEGNGGSGDGGPCTGCNGTGETETLTESVLGSISFKKKCQKCAGSKKSFSQVCHSCKGSGTKEVISTANIKAGMSQFRALEKGNFNPRLNSKPGDLIVTFEVKEHELFQLAENKRDVILQKFIGIKKIIFGGSVLVPTLSKAGRAKINVTRNCHGKRYLLKGMGLNGGSMIVEIGIDIPTVEDLNDDDIALINCLSENASPE